MKRSHVTIDRVIDNNGNTINYDKESMYKITRRMINEFEAANIKLDGVHRIIIDFEEQGDNQDHAEYY